MALARPRRARYLRGMFGRLSVLMLCLVSSSALSCSKSKEASQSSAEVAAAPKAAPAPAAEVVPASVVAKADGRAKRSCAELLTALSGPSTASVVAPPVAGSWGKVPAELQVVPPGAEHCGSIAVMGQAVIASSLSGKELEAFYAPLFAKLGCEPLQCKEARAGVLSQTGCHCEKALYLHGTLNTDPSSAAYLVGVKDMREGR